MSFAQGQPGKLPPPLSVTSSTSLYPPLYLKPSRYPINKPRSVRLVHPHQKLNPSLPPATSIVYTSLEPQRFPPAPAPLRAAPVPLKAPKSPTPNGCGTLAGGNESVDKGNCYVEQYENGYRDEEEKKIFYDDGKSNVNTEKHGERNSANYRNEAVYHLDKKRHRQALVKGPSYPNESASVRPAPPLPPLPPNKEELAKIQSLSKAIYFKPLKNGNIKFIVRPSDIQYVKVQNVKKLRPGDDVKLVEITKSRKILPGTKIDTVKIVENTEPQPEDEDQSDENELEGSRKVRQKSKSPIKTYKNVKIRGKITRLITPGRSVSETKVSPLWSQETSTDPKAEPLEDDDESFGDSSQDDNGYKVYEKQAESSEVPSLLLTNPDNLIVRARPGEKKPRRSVKHATSSSYPFFDDDSWTAAQTEVAKRLKEYWETNADRKPGASSLSYDNQQLTSSSLPSSASTGSEFRTSSHDSFRRVTPFEYLIVADSASEKSKAKSDPFVPSTLQEEFLPSDPKHPVASGRGKSEQAILSGEFEHSAEEDFDMSALAPLGKETETDAFKPMTSPSNTDAFGINDPDRLDPDAVPVVEESSHKRKGYKETRQHEQKRWR